VILDFVSGTDKIQLLGFTAGPVIISSGADTTITVDGTKTITLIGVDSSDISLSDFLFT
jgi:hypothetical protein